MHRWIYTTCFCLLLVSDALALSCMPPTPESIFALNRKYSGRYMMAVGTISLLDPFPKFNRQTLRYEPSERIRAEFTGHIARATGFDLRASFPVTVEMKCFDEVCGFLPLRRPAAMFIRIEEGRYLVSTDYCSSTMLPDPSDADLARLIACFDRNGC